MAGVGQPVRFLHADDEGPDEIGTVAGPWLPATDDELLPVHVLDLPPAGRSLASLVPGLQPFRHDALQAMPDGKIPNLRAWHAGEGRRGLPAGPVQAQVLQPGPALVVRLTAQRPAVNDQQVAGEVGDRDLGRALADLA